MTSIEWTDAVWNPTVGCSRVSAGCENCYAERVANRGMTEAHRGLTVVGKKGPRWTGEVRLMSDRLDQPLRWRKPRRVFVDSMSDLFHPGVPFEFIAAVFGVMAASPQHTFQVLTKRPERAAEFFGWVAEQALALAVQRLSERLVGPSRDDGQIGCTDVIARAGWYLQALRLKDTHPALHATWPLPNVWLGVSVEDQATADERIPVLLRLPAAVRWVSYEPALGQVDFRHVRRSYRDDTRWVEVNALRPDFGAGLDWIVVGGESGPGARPFDLAWARSTIAQCREAGVPVFVKQLGADPHQTGPAAVQWRMKLSDRKGGDPSEWPEDLRVREWPGGAA